MSLRQQAEAKLISALLNNKDIHQAAQYGISPDMFEAHQAEFRWGMDYQRVHGDCPSPEIVREKFPGFVYYSDKKDIPYYIEDFLQRYNHAKFKKAIKDASTLVGEGDLDEAILVLGGFNQRHLSQPLENALYNETFLDTYHEEIDVIIFPWLTLQEVTGGIRKGELYYLAARLGQGKSWSLVSTVGQALMDGRDVLFYTLEMSEVQVLTRLHVWLGHQMGMDVDHLKMRNKTFDLIQYRKIVKAIRDEVPGKLYLRDSSKGIISTATLQGGQNREVDLIVVDHVGLMHSASGGRAIDDWRVMASISNQLKEISVGQQSRLLCAAQINREGEKEGGFKVKTKWPPKTRHLAQSDALGQDADVVVTHRRWGSHTQCYSIEKTRDGQSEVKFWTKFEPNIGNFQEISRDEAEDRYEDEEDD